MINIVIMTDSVFHTHIVINRGQDVLFCNMFGNQIMGILTDDLRQLFG